MPKLPKHDRERKDAMRFVGWMREALGLEDWTIVVQVSTDPPEEDKKQVIQDQVISQSTILGQCKADALTKTATIWVCGTDLYSTLGHEVCHILAADLGIPNDTEDRFEFAWSKIGDLLVLAYRVGKGKAK